jgi:hypothetical protein
MRKPHHQPRYMGPKTLAGLLKTAGFWSRLHYGSGLTKAAAETIDYLDKRQGDLRQELGKTKQQHRQEIERLETEAKGLTRRTLAAIDEMTTYKRGSKSETPVAVVLSPYQHSLLTLHGFFRQSRIKGLDIIIAKGVYGPVVLTQDGVNGFTRSAPELGIRLAGPSRESDW